MPSQKDSAMIYRHDLLILKKILEKQHPNIIYSKKYNSIWLLSVYKDMLKSICNSEKDNFLQMQTNSKEIFDVDLGYECV